MAWQKIGTILKGNKGSYMKIEFVKDKDGKAPSEVTLKAGQTLQIYDPRKSKFITEERLAKIPEYVKAEVFITPDRDPSDRESNG
jgi:hypothetical protein